MVKSLLFMVSPYDWRVGEFMRRMPGQELQVQSYIDKDGALYASPAVYFGATLFCARQDEEVTFAKEDFGVISGEEILRADYAYQYETDETMLLRAGRPGEEPKTWNEMAEGTRKAMLEEVKAHIRRPYVDIVARQDEKIADESILFSGEKKFSEGLIGFGAVALPIRRELAETRDGNDMQAVVGFSEKHDAERIGKLIFDFLEER